MFDRRYRAAIALFGLVVLCTALSASRWMVSRLIPWQVICCQILGMSMDGDPYFSWVNPSLRFGFLVLFVYAMSNLIWRVWRTHSFISALFAVSFASPSARLSKLLEELGLSSHVVFVASHIPIAFTFGLFRPRICLSHGMDDLLTDRQLEAVLLHEEKHRRRFDPLRTLLAEWIGAVFFFLPIIAELRDLFLTRLELQADRHAVQQIGRPALAGALYAILSHPQSANFPDLAGISHINATDARIAQLLGDIPFSVRFSARSLIISSAIVMLVCILS